MYESAHKCLKTMAIKVIQFLHKLLKVSLKFVHSSLIVSSKPKIRVWQKLSQFCSQESPFGFGGTPSHVSGAHYFFKLVPYSGPGNFNRPLRTSHFAYFRQTQTCFHLVSHCLGVPAAGLLQCVTLR